MSEATTTEGTVASPKRMTQAKLDAQGGKKKTRGFWKDDATIAVLKRCAENEITMEEAASELQTTTGAVSWALGERGFKQSKAKQDKAKAKVVSETPLPHGEEDEVPF